VSQVSVFILSLILSLLSTPGKNIEKAFLQNNSRLLYELLAPDSRMNLSLPEPISFADQLSSQQAYFLFQGLFSVYTTFEFYLESEAPNFTEGGGVILKARWSFRNNKNANQYVFEVYFYLIMKDPRFRRPGQSFWTIAEIRTEKL
jgi:hypothetical protein